MIRIKKPKNLRRLLLIPLLINVLAMAGCVPHMQLEQRLIIQAAAIDYENDMYVVTIQYYGGESLESKKNDPNESLFSAVGKGSTVSHALQEAGSLTGKPLFLGDCQIFILGESLKGKDLVDVLDVLTDEYEGYPQIALAIAKGKASDLLELKYNDQSITINKFDQILQENVKNGFIPNSELYPVVINLSNSLVCAYLPIFTIVDVNPGITEDGKTAAILNGALIKGGRYLDTIERTEVAGISFIQNKNMTSSITIAHNDRSMLVNLSNIKVRLSPKLIGNKIMIEVKYRANASYSQSHVDADVVYISDHIETLTEVAITERLVTSLNKVVTELGVDVFGLEETIRSKCYKGWMLIKDNWEEEIKNLDFHVTGKVEVTGYGVRW